MNELKVIEYNNIRVLTTGQLAEAYGTDRKTLSNNFSRNRDRYIEGKHYITLTGVEKSDFVNRHQFEDGLKNAQTIYLWTEKGCFLAAKSLNTDKAWEAYDKLIDSYFTLAKQFDLSQLPPEMQMFKKIWDTQAQTLLEQKRQEERISKVERIQEAIKEAVKPVTDNWREEINRKFNRIQKTCGADFKDLRIEMYNELDERAGADVATRLRNRKERMRLEGSTKSSIEKLNRMDIIENDKRLREIFSKIVTEYEIRFCA